MLSDDEPEEFSQSSSEDESLSISPQTSNAPTTSESDFAVPTSAVIPRTFFFKFLICNPLTLVSQQKMICSIVFRMISKKNRRFSQMMMINSEKKSKSNRLLYHLPETNRETNHLTNLNS